MVEALQTHPSDRPDVVGITVALEPSTTYLFKVKSDQDRSGGPYRFHDLLLSSLTEAFQKYQGVAAGLMQELFVQPIDRWGGQPLYTHHLLWVPTNLVDSLTHLAAAAEIPPMRLAHDLLVDSLG